MTIKITETTWNYPVTGGIDLTLHNCITDVSETRHYKTKSAAKAAETKFTNRVNRVYAKRIHDLVWGSLGLNTGDKEIPTTF